MKRLITLMLAFCLLFSACATAETSPELENMLAKGKEYVQVGDFDSAAICYDIALKLSPEDPGVLAAMADMYSMMGEYEQALSYMEQALALSPADGTLYLAKAKILYVMGRLDDAETAARYGEICGAAQDDALRLTAAVAYGNGKNYSKAVEMFDSVPADIWWDIHSELYGRALVAMGERARAEELGLVKAVQKDGEIADALRNGRGLSLKTIDNDISGLPVFCAAAVFEEAVQTYGFENALGEAAPDGQRVKMYESLGETQLDEVSLLTTSPTGNAALYRLNDCLALRRDGEITLILPNYSRGAQDEEYAPFTYGSYRRFAASMEPDSVVWSPDERYFTLTFPELTMIYARLLDLIVADTWTGDLFVTEATPKKITLPGNQSAVTACFDVDGKSIYYAVYGNIGETAKAGIKRYDLETGEVELLCAIEDYYIDKAGIWLDDEGAIRFVVGPMKASEHAGIAKVSLNGGRWDCVIENFPNDARCQYVYRYQYSANSGAELLLSGSSMAGYKYLTMRQPGDTEVISNGVMLPKNGSGKAELVPIDTELAARFEEIYAVMNGMIYGNNQIKSADDIATAYPWMNIINAEMSPDGCYALILAANTDVASLYILDMQTLLYVEVELPENAALNEISALNSRQVNKMLAWNEDGTIMIPCKGGNIVCSLEIG